MPKAHFVDSAEPLISGQDYVSRCGQEIKRAEWAAYFDGQYIDGQRSLASLDFRGICGKCVKEVLESGAKRYLYAGLNGSEFRDLEA